MIQKIWHGLIYSAKAFIGFCLLVILAIKYDEIPYINPYLLFIYFTSLIACVVSIGLTIFPKLSKLSYMVFFLSLIVFLLLDNSSPIKDSINCSAIEHGTWDYTLNICRQDCLTWDKELGCVPVTKENISK